MDYGHPLEFGYFLTPDADDPLGVLETARLADRLGYDGANKPRALALTGRVADGWVCPLMSYKPPREAAEGNLAIDRAAHEAGRDPGEIRRIYNVQGAFTSTTQGPAADTDQGIVGPAERWIEVLTHFAVDLGFGTFVLATPPDPDTLTTFIEDVAPKVRERVAQQREERRA